MLLAGNVERKHWFEMCEGTKLCFFVCFEFCFFKIRNKVTTAILSFWTLNTFNTTLHSTHLASDQCSLPISVENIRNQKMSRIKENYHDLKCVYNLKTTLKVCSKWIFIKEIIPSWGLKKRFSNVFIYSYPDNEDEWTNSEKKEMTLKFVYLKYF